MFTWKKKKPTKQKYFNPHVMGSIISLKNPAEVLTPSISESDCYFEMEFKEVSGLSV